MKKVKWEYSARQDEWKELKIVLLKSDYELSAIGAKRLVKFNVPGDWIKTTYGGETKYWVRMVEVRRTDWLIFRIRS